MVIAKTQRLTLAEFTITDAGFLHRLMNTPGWLKFIGERGIVDTIAAHNYILNDIRPSYVKNGFGIFKVLIKDTEQSIGTCGLLQRNFLEHPDLGFSILPEFERKGYAFEASKAVLDYVKSVLDLHTILAFANPENLASLRLLAKLGFQNYKTITPDKKQLVLLKKVL